MKNTITQAQIDALISLATITVTTVYDKVTVVAVRLPSGFVLVDSTGAVDPANYREEIGREICLSRIKNKIWELEGYRLSCELAAPQVAAEAVAKGGLGVLPAQSPAQKPTIGRTVGYRAPGWHSRAGETFAAIVTGVAADGVVSLDVFSPPNCLAFTKEDTAAVAYDAAGAPHTWHWLPRA